MTGFYRITAAKWRERGALRNTNNARVMRSGRWHYYARHGT